MYIDPEIVRLRVLPALLPTNGVDAEMRISPDGLYLQQRVAGGGWENLVSIDAITGPSGPIPEFQFNGVYLQYRIGDGPWFDIVALTEYAALQGPRGDPGPKGDAGPPGVGLKGDKGDKGDPGPQGEGVVTFASNSQAEAGTATFLAMDPLRTRKAIDIRRGAADGLAPLGSDGIVPSVHLPNLTRYKDFYASEYAFSDAQTPAEQQTIVNQMVADVAAAGGGRIVIDRVVRTTVGFRIFGMSDVLIEGSGKGAIQLTTDSTQPAVRIEQASTRVTVRGLRVFGPSNWSRATAKMGIWAQNATHVRVEDCHVSLTLAGVWLNRVTYGWVENCFVKDLYADGIHFALGCTWCVAKGNHVEGQTDDALACTSDIGDASASGLAPLRTSHIMFLGNTTGNARAPLWGNGIVAYESDHVTISDNDIFAPACCGISISSHDDTSQMCRYITIADNRIFAPGQAQKLLDQPSVDTGYVQGSGMFLTDIQYGLIVNNRIDQVTANPDTSKAGIFLQHIGQTEVVGNRIRQVAGYGITGNGVLTDLTVAGNIIEDTNNSAIDFKVLGAGLTGFLDVSGNKTRRINGAFAINIGNPASLGNLVVADNIDANLKASNVDYRAALALPTLKNNTPPIWYPISVSWSSVSGSLTVSTTSARFCIEGGSYVVNAVGNISANNGGGVALQLPFTGASGERVAFLTGWMAVNNVPFIGRHRDGSPGSYTFVNAGSSGSTQVAPIGTGEIRVEGRIPIS